MIDPNELSGQIKWFLDLCINHPYLSILVALLLLIGAIAHLFDMLKSLVTFVISTYRTGSSSKKAMLSAGIIGLVFLAVASPIVAHVLAQPKPQLSTKPGNHLAKEFLVAWDYKDDASRIVEYEVTVRDASNPGTSKTYTSKTQSIALSERGQLGIQVRAVVGDWRSRPSEELMVEVYDDSIERMKAKREIVVAVHKDNSDGLFCFVKKGSREFDGFDIDLIDLIGKKLEEIHKIEKLKIVKKLVAWPEIIEAPNTYDVDFSVSSISITPKRQQTVLFSRPYWQTEVAMLQRQDMAKNRGEVTLSELKGLVIGVHKGTTAVDFMNQVKKKQRSIQIGVYNDNSQLFASLQNGSTSAIVYDHTRMMAETERRVDMVQRKFNKKSFDVQPERYGIAFAKANSRLKGDVDRILTKYETHVTGLMRARIEGLTATSL